MGILILWLFIFKINQNIISQYLCSQSLISVEKELGDLSNKPNTTQPILGFNPEWNDIIFVETFEENVQKDGKF